MQSLLYKIDELEIVIEKLIALGKAEIIWDTDAYYTNNTNQEAGYFFRKYNQFEKFKKFNDSNIVLEIIQLLLWLVECSDWRFLFDNVNGSKLQKVLIFREDEWEQAYVTIKRMYHYLGIVLRH